MARNLHPENFFPRFAPIPPRHEGLRPCSRCEGLFRSSHGNQTLCGSCRHGRVSHGPGAVSFGLRLCALCGREYVARSWTQKYCSPRHKHAARREIDRRRYANPSHRGGRARWRPVVATGSVRCARGAACRRAEVVGSDHVGGLIHPGGALAPWTSGRRKRRGAGASRLQRGGADPAGGGGAEGVAGLVSCGPGVIVAGSERPAMSVAFADPRGAFGLSSSRGSRPTARCRRGGPRRR